MRMQNPLAMIASNQFDLARANPMMNQIMGRLGFAGGASQTPMNTGADPSQPDSGRRARSPLRYAAN